MHNITAGLKLHKRSKQIILPTKMYTEREKLRQMEISEPLPSSALQDLCLQQTRQVKTNRNCEKPKSSKRNTNKAVLRPNQLTLGSTQEVPLAVKVFDECVLPELKANLPQSKSTIDGVLSIELQPSVDGTQRSYASIYEIPPAAQTWRRSDCFKGRSEEGFLNEIMKEINMRSASATYIISTPDNCKPMK
uniref:Uncharacterized protein n=1 Tax=Bactrocera latifrons TaxID=174628 RepID=A0A0K8UHK2_BACLA